MTARKPQRIPLDDLAAKAWDKRAPIEFTPTEAHLTIGSARYVAALEPVEAAR